MARSLVGPVEIAGDKVAADTEQKAVRCDLSPTRRLVPYTSIEDVNCPAALERGNKGLIHQLVRNRPRSRSRGETKRLKKGLLVNLDPRPCTFRNRRENLLLEALEDPGLIGSSVLGQLFARSREHRELFGARRQERGDAA